MYGGSGDSISHPYSSKNGPENPSWTQNIFEASQIGHLGLTVAPYASAQFVTSNRAAWHS